MKRIVLNYLVIAVVATFTSCDKNDDKSSGEVRLLETITESNGNFTRFEYDNQNRITKLSLYRNGNLTRSETLTYSGNNLVKMEEKDNSIHEFVKKGNTITGPKTKRAPTHPQKRLTHTPLQKRPQKQIVHFC